MAGITSHVLNLGLGTPARGMIVQLDILDSRDAWRTLHEGATNDDGRVPNMLEGREVEPGIYRMIFETGHYYSQSGTATFYPRVEVIFEVDDPTQHHHVPLLISPFGYSTYRGS